VTLERIFILGAGGVGSVIGALLSKKNDVTLIGNREHVQAVNSRGLTVYGDVNETFRLSAEPQIREVPARTLIFLTTKAYDSEKAMRQIRRLVRKDTVVLILQNGLGNEDVVKRAVDSNVKVLRGITNMAVEFFKAGEVRYWKGETIIEHESVTEEIAETMNSCGLNTSLSDNITQEIWKKVVINSVINPLTAILRVRNHEVSARPLATVRRQILRECVQVGKTEGVALPKDLETEIDRGILGYTNYSSMCQDVMKGRTTEIGFLNGKVAELGAKHHVPTPVNETLVHLVRFLEGKDELPRED
jgi:2-dehydropantoate 2-reductase